MVQCMPVRQINCGFKILIVFNGLLVVQKTKRMCQALLLRVSCLMNNIKGLGFLTDNNE